VSHFPWWWVPAGLAAWFAVAVAAGLVIGPALRRGSRARARAEAGFRDWLALRECCPTGPGESHQGTCRNSVMNTGEWRP